MDLKHIILMIALLLLPLGICSVNAEDFDEEIVFHLDTTQINFTNSSLEQPISFHITTNDIYHNDAARYFDYTVSTSNTILKDTRGTAKTLNVTAGASVAGILDITKTIPYNGNIMVTTEKTTSPGIYKGKATVTFNYELNSDLNSYTITLNDEGVISTITVAPNKTPVLPTPTKPGYKFLGWFTEHNIQVTNSTVITSDMTLYAHWKGEYKVNCNLYNSNTTSRVYDDDTANFNLTTLTRSGYTFVGWTGTDLDEPTLNVTVDTSKKKDYTFTAHWAKTETPIYNVETVSHNGCTLSDIYVGVEGGKYTVFLNVLGPVTLVEAPTWNPSTPTIVDWNPLGPGNWTRAGRPYNYAKNFDGKAGEREYATDIYLTCNGTKAFYYSLKHTASHSTFTLHLNGGTGINTYVKDYNYGEHVDLTAWETPIKEGYTFFGWSTLETNPTDIIKDFYIGPGGNNFYAILVKNSNM